jgi:hypothetical protein
MNSILSFRNPLTVIGLSYLAAYFLFYFIPTFCVTDSMSFFEGVPKAKTLGLDFFATLKMSLNEYMIPYSPLGKLLFPIVAKSNWGNNFYFITALTLIASAVSFGLVSLMVKIENKWLFFTLLILYLSSYGFLFEIERGQWNILAMSLVLAAVYLSRKDMIILPAILFALAVSLKLYPILFAPALIKDYSRIKESLKMVLAVCISNAVLFLILGVSIFKWYVRIMTKYSDIKTSWIGNHSLTSFNIMYGYNWIKPFVVVLLMFMIAWFVYQNFKNHLHNSLPHFLSILALTSCVLPSVSHDYKLSILGFFIPLVLCRHKELNLTSGVLLLMTSFAYFSTLYSYVNFYYFHVYILESKFLVLLALVVFIFVDYLFWLKESKQKTRLQ